MFTLANLGTLRYVVKMEDGWIPNDFLYGELAQGNRLTVRLQLRYIDVCKRDLKALGIDINGWETFASERSAWKQAVQQGLFVFEEHLPNRRRQRDKRGRLETRQIDQQLTTFAHCMGGTFIPDLVFLATKGAFRVPPI